MKSSIIYIDERLVAINKGAGISLATRRAEPHGAVRRLLESLPSETCQCLALDPSHLWLVHRLDAGTTGLVLLARDEQAHRELSEQFQKRLVAKTYLALVWGHPRPRQGRYDWPIGPDTRDRRRMKAGPGGSMAVTHYRTLTIGPHVSLLELHPKTGRTHQIRVHLAKAGHWIVGDDLYGGPRHRGIKQASLRQFLNPHHILLHSWRIELSESTSLCARQFEAPLPPIFVAVLEALHMEDALAKWGQPIYRPQPS